MKIQLTETTYNADKKGIFREKKTEIKEISETSYNLLTDYNTAKCFRRLGGSEFLRKSYTCRGYKVTYMSSTSPDKTIKIVREFKFL